MKISKLTTFIGSAVIVAGLFSLSAISSARTVKTEKSSVSLKNVYFLYANNWSGDKGFARRTQRDIAKLGFQWTRDRKKAHALVNADTSWHNGAFWGELTFIDRNGRIIWHETALRPRNSNYMASDRLIDKLRRAVKAARVNS